MHSALTYESDIQSQPVHLQGVRRGQALGDDVEMFICCDPAGPHRYTCTSTRIQFNTGIHALVREGEREREREQESGRGREMAEREQESGRGRESKS